MKPRTFCRGQYGRHIHGVGLVCPISTRATILCDHKPVGQAAYQSSRRPRGTSVLVDGRPSRPVASAGAAVKGRGRPVWLGCGMKGVPIQLRVTGLVSVSGKGPPVSIEHGRGGLSYESDLSDGVKADRELKEERK